MISSDNIHLKNIPEIWHRVSFNGYNSGYITTDIKPTKYGYHITRFSNFVSLISIRYEIYDDEFSKAICKVSTNYRPNYQYTLYFDRKKNEIRSSDNSTRKELNMWNNLRKHYKIHSEISKKYQK